jgi:hypothetical protein
VAPSFEKLAAAGDSWHEFTYTAMSVFFMEWVPHLVVLTFPYEFDTALAKRGTNLRAI